MNDKDRVNVTCVDCGKTFDVSYGKFRKYKGDHEWRCHDCRYKHHGDVIKSKWANSSQEEKSKRGKAISVAVTNYWANLDPIARQEINSKIGDSNKKAWENKTPEEYAETIKKFSESHKNRWTNYSPEEKELRIIELKRAYEDWYANLSDEERRKYHEKQNEFRNNVMSIDESIRKENDATLWRYKQPDETTTVKCEHCGKSFDIKVSSITTRYKNGTPNLCHDCMGEWISKSNAKRYQQLSDFEKRLHSRRTKYQLSIRTPEEWEEINKKNSEGLKKHWATVSDEERKRITDPMNKGWKEWYDSLSDEEKSKRAKDKYENMSDETKQMYSDKMKEYNDSIPYEEKLRRMNAMNDVVAQFTPEQKADMYTRSHQWINDNPQAREEYSKQRKEFWESLSDERKAELAQKQKDWWNNLPADDKEAFSKLQKDIWENKTPEEKEGFIQRQKQIWENKTQEEKDAVSQKHKEWWENLPANDKEAFADTIQDRFNNLPIRTKEELIKKKLSHSVGHNKFHQKFERAFSESHLVNSHYIKAEYPTTNNGVTHCWDYGVFDKDSNQLQMVVDLDGAYFHGDNTDYDGIHSREEYDERRWLSIPEGIHHCIIPEMRFKDAFEFMLKLLMTNYDEYVMYVFKQLRSQPFPYPSYSKVELLKSWDQLRRMKTDDKYHESVSVNTRQGDRLIQHFHQSIWHDHRDGELSPYEAWKDDELLLKVIKNRIIYQTYLNPNKILQGFNIAKVATKVSVFSAGRAKMIVNRYLSDFETVFDPFSGYSGRMLGVTAAGKKYIGQDISERHVAETNNIIDFLHKYAVEIDATVTQKDIFQSSGEYPCLFTCSPYSTKEQWEDVPVNNMSCDDWIDVCLERFKCRRYVFVVDTTEKYKDYVVAEISNKSHFSNAKEKIIVINK